MEFAANFLRGLGIGLTNAKNSIHDAICNPVGIVKLILSEMHFHRPEIRRKDGETQSVTTDEFRYCQLSLENFRTDMELSFEFFHTDWSNKSQVCRNTNESFVEILDLMLAGSMELMTFFPARNGGIHQDFTANIKGAPQDFCARKFQSRHHYRII